MLHFFQCLFTCMRPSCQDGNPLAMQDDTGLRRPVALYHSGVRPTCAECSPCCAARLTLEFTYFLSYSIFNPSTTLNPETHHCNPHEK